MTNKTIIEYLLPYLMSGSYPRLLVKVDDLNGGNILWTTCQLGQDISGNESSEERSR